MAGMTGRTLAGDQIVGRKPPYPHGLIGMGSRITGKRHELDEGNDEDASVW